MNSGNIKTIIVDLDRTLLHSDLTISSYTVEVFRKCKANGMRIIIATARPLRRARQYCELIDADAMVVSNGARLVCRNQRVDYAITTQSALRLLNTLLYDSSLLITLETGDAAYSNMPIEDSETIISDNLVSIAESEGVLKFLVRLDGEETLTAVKEALTEDLYYTIAHGHLIQIMNRSATKWSGIKAMLDLCGGTAAEAAYFGDDHDDIEPIKMCAMGIAVANSIDEVKNAADYIAGSNDTDGVARFIDQVILGRL